MRSFDMVPVDRVRYGVVLNDVSGATALPVDLGGWTFRWATGDEVAELHPRMVTYAQAHYDLLPPQVHTIEPSGSGVTFNLINNSEDWRYSVMEPRPENAIFGARLTEATRLTSADLRVEHWVTQRPPGSDGPVWVSGGNPGQCIQFFSRFFRPPVVPNLVEVARVVDLRRRLVDDRYPQIAKAVALFRELDVVPEHSRLKLLGYFSVLESLLAHAPAANDPVDSITRQLQRNLLLLANRAPEGEEFGLDEFQNCSASQVTAKLYRYRSAVAHGGDGIDVLNWLEERRPERYSEEFLPVWLHAFIRVLVKRVLVAALREPQLVIDLRGP